MWCLIVSIPDLCPLSYFNQIFSSLTSLGQSKILYLFLFCFFIPLRISLLPKIFLARTQIIYLVSCKGRFIALIVIMHVYKCMQIQIAFRLYNNQVYTHSIPEVFAQCAKHPLLDYLLYRRIQNIASFRKT